MTKAMRDTPNHSEGGNSGSHPSDQAALRRLGGARFDPGREPFVSLDSPSKLGRILRVVELNVFPWIRWTADIAECDPRSFL